MGNLPYEAYIFDLDGTLTESEPGIVKSVQYALEKMGIPGYSREDLQFTVGPPLMHSFMEGLGMSEADAAQTVRYFQERYGAKGYLENSVYPGIPALLKSLKAQGAWLGIATGKPERFTIPVLETFGLAKYFDAAAAPLTEDEAPYKDRLIPRALPEKPVKACIVGDRDLDIQAGKTCGIHTVGVLYGYGRREELAGADLIADNVEHLTTMLLGDAPRAKGCFVTIEGSDGCGKSTQAKRLAEELALLGHRVIHTREPGGCRISERIRGIVLDAREEGMSNLCEALLFAAARAQHVHEVIRPALLRGDVVVCDRFVDSSMVYQGAGRGLGDVVEQINRVAVDGCTPDLTLLLDIDPALAMARRVAAERPDRIEKERDTFVQKVYRAYRALAEQDPQRFRLIDASGSPDEVFARIRDVILREL